MKIVLFEIVMSALLVVFISLGSSKFVRAKSDEPAMPIMVKDEVMIEQAKIVVGEYITKTKNNLKCSQITKIAKYKVVYQSEISARELALANENTCLVRFKKDPGLKLLKKAIKTDTRFQYIEPNFVRSINQ